MLCQLTSPLPHCTSHCMLCVWKALCVAQAGLKLVILLPPPPSANPTGVCHHNRLYAQAKVGGGYYLGCFTFHLNHCYFWLWGIFCLQKRNFTAFNINTRLPANLRGSFVSSLSLGGVMLMQGCTVTHIARVTDDIYHTPLNLRRHTQEGAGPLILGQGID